MREPDDAAAEDGQAQLPEHATVAVHAGSPDPAVAVQSEEESLPSGDEEPAMMPSRQLASSIVLDTGVAS